ncbi:ParB N-terminal domain-containing protein [Nitrosomonas ureae]|nr:ParB N-terminal domain-containing protein [Nitrosomonas ureae]
MVQQIQQMIQTKTYKTDLTKLKLLEGNPRYMTPAQFKRLVKNLENDGVLTSAPLIYQNEVLSGNHRVQAAIAAGIIEADVIEIISPLTESEKKAIALSHNAIAGQDNLSLLQEYYDSLDSFLKEYSGLTDDIFKVEELDISTLSVGAPKYQQLNLLFLPEEMDVFMELVKNIGKKQESVNLCGKIDDFDQFFEAVTQTKKVMNIHNSAVALRTMAQLTMERLEEIEKESAAVETNEQ